MTKKKIHISWSGGKDAGLALDKILQDPQFEVVGLHTVIERDTGRVGLHEIDKELIQKQAEAIGLPIEFLLLDRKPMAYQKLMQSFYNKLAKKEVQFVMFGDIYLDDLRDFRDTLLKAAGITGVYPLWKKNPFDLVSEFLSKRFASRICAVNTDLIDSRWLGQALSPDFVAEHDHIDPCGENGEYHSFLTNAPYFEKAVQLEHIETFEQTHTFKLKNEAGEIEEQSETFAYGKFTSP